MNVLPIRKLPKRPDLEHLRREAKELLRGYLDLIWNGHRKSLKKQPSGIFAHFSLVVSKAILGFNGLFN